MRVLLVVLGLMSNACDVPFGVKGFACAGNDDDLDGLTDECDVWLYGPVDGLKGLVDLRDDFDTIGFHTIQLRRRSSR